MKILNRQQFLQMPSGTLYREFEPCVFEELRVKGQTISGRAINGVSTDEFAVLHLDLLDAESSEAAFEMMERATKTGESFRFDFDNNWSRDGWSPEKNEQLYAVYERERTFAS